MECFHFDLYRIENYEIFVNIGGEEILENPKSLKIIEWPEVLMDRYRPNIIIRLSTVGNEPNTRNIEIEYLD